MDFELKSWEPEYLADLFNATLDRHLSDNLVEPFPCPMDTAFAMEFIKQRMLNSEQKQMCRAIVIDGHAYGSVEILIGNGIFSKCAYISIWLDKQKRGKGLGAASLKKMAEMVFAKYQVYRIEARPYSRDTAVIKALIGAGFVHEGTLRNYIYTNQQIFDCEIFAITS